MADASVPLTAEQIDILTKDWPAGAKPKDVYFDPHGQPYMLCVCPRQHCAIHPSDAAALFRDSGLRWLMGKTGMCSVEHIRYIDDSAAYCVDLGNPIQYVGPTLLHAISAAISAAIKRERGEHE